MSAELSAGLETAVKLGSEMGQRFASFDWASHPLGPPAEWSAARQAAVAIALGSRFPIVLWLGDELSLVYNDDYVPVLGEKHPAALGRPGAEVWSEIWDPIGPMLAGVMATGVATWSSDLMLPVITAGHRQERFFTFTYSPLVEGDGKLGGVFCAVTETTERVLGERRLEALTALGSGLIDATSTDEVVAQLAEVFASRSADVPFLAAYLGDAAGDPNDPVCRVTTGPAGPVLRDRAARLSGWGLRGVPGGPVVIDELASRLPDVASALGDVCPNRALALPIGERTNPSSAGALVIGLNPLRPLDGAYMGFCRLISDQVTGALSGVGAYEHERRRAEALAQLDHAKTAFLTNVSHEFRTPLTLMLGPLEDDIADAGDDRDRRERLEMIHRNGARLLLMVNSLLSFARLETGAVEPRLVATDVARLTGEIASSFSDLCAQAGVDLVMRLSTAVAEIDLEMWETIVLNLVSNAFKFTLAGTITVGVTPADAGFVELTVADTGSGIAAGDLERIFERFYRPAHGRGRTIEGSGIGLALVKSLVEVQGGAIQLDSTPAVGTTVTVRLPAVDTAQLGELAGPTVLLAGENPFVTEARQWVVQESPPPSRPGFAGRPVVLVADDNRDMRRHLERILDARFDVILAADGEAALASIRAVQPDLVLADVMMPTLDGLGLVEAIRADPRLSALPVILLSARAGTEASGEGFSRGADDYIFKPFGTADLLNRVSARLRATMRAPSGSPTGRLLAKRSAALTELGAALEAARSVREALEVLVRAPLGTLMAGGISVGIVDPSNALIRCSYAGDVPPALINRYRTVPLDASLPVAEILRTRQTMIVENRSQLESRYGAEFAELAPDVAATMSVALYGKDQSVIGLLSLLWPEPQHFTTADIELVGQVAAMVAAAIERLSVTEAEHLLATQLQDRLLRIQIRSSAAAICSLYQPASDGPGLGGDWYTTLALDEEQVGISVGDVVGHGLTAAVTMSQLRSALQTAALSENDPDGVVGIIDRYATNVPEAFCSTLVYGILDNRTHTVTYSCAGHPYPLLLLPDGTVTFLEDGSRPPIGAALGRAPSRSGHALTPPGSLVIFYTDGLVERRNEPLDAGLARLADLAAGMLHEPVSDACSRLLAAMEPDGGFSDDVALVAIRPAGITATTFVRLIAATLSEVRPLRHALRDWLESLPIEPAVVADVLVAVGEAVNNAVEHGSGFDSRRRVSVELFADQDSITAAVSDDGQWGEVSGVNRTSVGRGNGLTLMRALAEDVSVSGGRPGTHVTLRFRTSTVPQAS